MHLSIWRGRKHCTNTSSGIYVAAFGGGCPAKYSLDPRFASSVICLLIVDVIRLFNSPLDPSATLSPCPCLLLLGPLCSRRTHLAVPGCGSGALPPMRVPTVQLSLATTGTSATLTCRHLVNVGSGRWSPRVLLGHPLGQSWWLTQRYPDTQSA